MVYELELQSGPKCLSRQKFHNDTWFIFSVKFLFFLSWQSNNSDPYLFVQVRYEQLHRFDS